MASVSRQSSRGAGALERVLIVDPQTANARLLSELLRSLTLAQVHLASTDQRGLAMARDGDPQIIFVELKAPGVDGLDFTRRLRRSDFGCRETPVIMMTAVATAASIVAARDAGMHEFLRRPFTIADLQKRIDAVTLKKRDWIEAVSYVGPDRRRFNSAGYTGPQKRLADQATPQMQRLSQALKIVLSALGAIESDPRQAFRALKAQADTLAAVARADPSLGPLGSETSRLQAYLEAALKAGRLAREPLEQITAALIEAAPPEARSDDGARRKQNAA